MEHLVSIKYFSIFYHEIACSLDFSSDKSKYKSFHVNLSFDEIMRDCVTKDHGRVWFREYATFLFRKFKQDLELYTKFNFEDYLVIFKAILYLAIERYSLDKNHHKDFDEKIYMIFYDKNNHKYIFKSYKEDHNIYPSEKVYDTMDLRFKLPNLVYITICKLYHIKVRLLKFFFYNSYDTSWLTDNRSDWRFLDDKDMVNFKENILSQKEEKDMEPAKELTADEMFKNLGYKCEFNARKGFEHLGHFEKTDHYFYSFPNNPINDKYIKIYTNGDFICNNCINPLELKAIIKKLEEIKNESNNK